MPLAWFAPSTPPSQRVALFTENGWRFSASMPGAFQREYAREARLAWIRYGDGLQGYLLELVSDRAQEAIVPSLQCETLPSALLSGWTMDIMVRSESACSMVEPFFVAH